MKTWFERYMNIVFHLCGTLHFQYILLETQYIQNSITRNNYAACQTGRDEPITVST